jgi:hypothetical protein
MHDAAQTARRGAEQAGETVYDAGRSRRSVCRTHSPGQPLLSLIGVAAIGYAIGFLLHSPTSPLVREPRPRHSDCYPGALRGGSGKKVLGHGLRN